MASAFCLYLVGSKGNVSAFFLAAMRSVGDVSDVLLSFSRAFQSQRFESFCGVLLSLSVVRSKGNVSRVFLATVSHGIGTKPFFACAPQVALRLFVRLLRPFLVFRGFRRQRFESFLLAVSVAFLRLADL